ncbi:MAG: DUF3131 domain-containing protein [Gemmatimonadetes bacterium]|nr:DUF3131 domain-containing protein [Gemmatimonadota bacterium]
MTRLIILLSVALLAAPVLSLVLGSRAGEGLISGPDPIAVPAEVAKPAAATARGTTPLPPPAPAFSRPGEAPLFDDATRTAWVYVSNQTNASTGLPNSVVGYPYGTIWDIGSALAALYCARGLGLIGEADYDARMSRVLRTLASMRLFDGAAFNKNYQVARGVPAGRNDRARPERSDGYGWSVIDIGRLLVWLKIVERADPEHAAQAAAIVARLDMERLIDDGYLQGGGLTTTGGVRTYQEGRIGYEQYAAAGFALWNARAERALSWKANVQEATVLGVPLLVDIRSNSLLTSEPFFLMGLELGWWDPEWRIQAERILAVQAARHEETGRLTMVSEDALPVAPYYFYYYTIFSQGDPFAVRAIGQQIPRPEPRWVSAKAAFAWYTLMPGEYTWRVVQEVSRRASNRNVGWSSGFYERGGRATGSENINTAAVILESALYRQRREPLVVTAGTRRTPAPAPTDSLPSPDSSRPPIRR